MGEFGRGLLRQVGSADWVSGVSSAVLLWSAVVLFLRRPPGTNSAIADARTPLAERDSVSEKASPRKSSIS